MVVGYKEDELPDLLPLYYRRLFPLELFYKWLSYGDSKKFNHREISFTLFGDVYMRYQSFATSKDFLAALCKRIPVKIDIGAIYQTSLNFMSGRSVPEERELVFDIDMTDYDHIRTCCTGAEVCPKCWKFMAIACKILDVALREDFGYKNLLWVFSGRRGIHCWVADESARRMDDNERGAVAEYLQVVKGGLQVKECKLPYGIHPMIQRSLTIIDKYFLNAIVVDQDILGTRQRCQTLLDIIGSEMSHKFMEPLLNAETSLERWKAFETTFKRLLQQKEVPRNRKNLIEEVKLHFSYPRLDIKVSTCINHLLKAPFCVHPKSGKVSIPIDPKFIDNFDPDTVPTVTQLVDEINAYDAQTKAQEQQLNESNSDVSQQKRIKDYKKTSLLKSVNIFNEFIRGLQSSNQRDKGQQMEF